MDLTAKKTTLLAIDPGPEQSAYVWLIDGEPGQSGIVPNSEMLTVITDYWTPTVAIEGIACYGMPVGKETFDTCIWIGRFIEAHGGRHTLVYRPEVKQHLCRSARAKDANVRQALIDRFGPGKDKAIGKKAAPGPLYGIKSHCWSALAVAVTWWDTKRKEPNA
jgi:hypothetical protein